MANTCFNSIRITGPQEHLEKLQQLITDIARIFETRYEKSMMYSLLKSLGYHDHDLYANPDADYREEFKPDALGAPLKIEDGVLELSTESAWDFHTESWELIRKALPGTQVYYLAEELCGDVFITNDVERRFFKTKWYLDSEEVDSEYFNDNRALVEFVHDKLDSTVETIEDVHAFLERTEEQDRFFSLHEITRDKDARLAS